MAFLRSPFAGDPPPSLRDGHALIRVPEMGDYEQWAALRAQSREFLTPWEPIWPTNDLTRTAFRSRIRQYWRDIDEDVATLTKQHRTEDAQRVVWAETDAEQLRRLYYLRDIYTTPPDTSWSTGWWDASRYRNAHEIGNVSTKDDTVWGQLKASILAGGSKRATPNGAGTLPAI